MCALTFFPTQTGYIFTHNRDENYFRENALPPQWHQHKSLEILFPKDGRAGGTWIAYRENTSICLLNGAFEKHEHKPPYRLSRGIVLLDIFQYPSLAGFNADYNLTDIEPFTVVYASGRHLSELRWDGNKKYFAEKEFRPGIWSSATLYDSEARKKRHSIFEQFLALHPEPSAEEIFSFHHTGKVGNAELDLVMERPNGLKTLSISQIMYSDAGAQFRYEDMLNGESHLLSQGP